MIKEKTFLRKYCVWNPSGLSSRGIDISSIQDIPMNMVIHHASNFGASGNASPIPNLAAPFMSNLAVEKKLVYNMTSIPQKGIVTDNVSKIKLMPGGINSALMQFKSENSSEVKYTETVSDLTPGPAYHLVVNYNPLFINRITGANKQVSLVDGVLCSIAHNITDLENHLHIIPIKLTSAAYEKMDFVKLYDKMDKVSIRYPEHHDYLLLAHFYSWLNQESSVGVLNLLPAQLSDKIYIALTRGKDSVIYSLNTLREMATTSKNILLKVMNQLNTKVGSDSFIDERYEPAPTQLLDITPENTAGTNNKDLPSISEQMTNQKKAIAEVETKTNQLIDNQSMLSPKQKQRLKEHAVAYKKIEIDGAKLEEILAPKDNSINDSELDFLEGVDEDSKKSTIAEFDQQYVENDMEKDIAQTLLSFSKSGMLLKNLEKTKIVDKLNRMCDYRVQFESLDGKTHTMHFQIPIVDEDGRCFINGNYKTLIKQRVNVPIVKISGERVSLNSNYNKLIVQVRNRPRLTLKTQVSSLVAEKNLRMTFDDTDVDQITAAKDYTELAVKFGQIYSTDGTVFEFNYADRLLKAPKDAEALEKKHNAVYFGKNGTKETFLIQLDGTVLIIRKDEIAKTNMVDILNTYLGGNFKSTGDYAAVNMLDKHLPAVFLLAYRFGLTYILDYMDANYQVVDKGTRVTDLPASSIVVQFKDKKLIIERIPESIRLMFTGLQMLKLNDIYYEDMNTKDAYFNILESLKLSLNYIKGIDGFFDLFMDPITADVLSQMGEPTNLKDLLIRAIQLLTTSYHESAASAKNFRFRSYERYPAMVYNTIARALHAYKYKSAAGVKFSIKNFDIKSRIMKDPLLNNTTSVNPIKELKDQTNFNYIGDGGRDKSTFMVKDRVFPKDNVGIVSESSSDSMDTGVNCYTVSNPNIVNRRGMTQTKDPDIKSIAKVGSVTTNVLAGTTNDD